MMRVFFFVFLVGLIGLAGCSAPTKIANSLSLYQVDINQGNFVTQEMVVQLKPGQTRDQVRFILGSPLVADMFHADRWDYIYRFKPGGGVANQRRLVVFFEEDKLVRIEGDVVADKGAAANSPKPAISTIDIPADSRKK